jgi:GAF domain-containing protein
MIFHPARDLDACNKKVKQLTHCIEIANLINSELDIDRLLTQIMATTRHAFNADSVSLLLTDEKNRGPDLSCGLGEKSDEIKEIFRVKKDQGIAGHVARTGIPLNLKDAYEHPDFSADYDRTTGYRTRAMLCAPLITRGRTLGVIQIINKLSPPGFFHQRRTGHAGHHQYQCGRGHRHGQNASGHSSERNTGTGSEAGQRCPAELSSLPDRRISRVMPLPD